jgi:hypothetical protein
LGNYRVIPQVKLLGQQLLINPFTQCDFLLIR